MLKKFTMQPVLPFLMQKSQIFKTTNLTLHAFIVDLCYITTFKSAHKARAAEADP